MNGVQRVGRWEIGLLIAILSAAALLRLGWPGLTEFKRDEASLTALALDMAELSQFHVRGIDSSVGVPNSPVSVWLYALPLLVWRHVYAATLYTGLVNVLAVLGCWWLVRRYWGPTAALAAAAMFAVSPWAVFHSRKIWAQNLLPPLTMAWGISGLLAFVEGRRRFVVLHLLSLALAVQVHFAGITLLPGTGALLLIFRRRVSWRLVLAGAGLAMVASLPYLRSLLAGPAGALGDTVNTLGAMGRGMDFQAWRHAWLLSTGAEIHALAGPESFAEFLESAPDRLLVHGAWALLMIGGLLTLIAQSWSRPVAGRPGHRPGSVPPTPSDDIRSQLVGPPLTGERGASRRQSEAALLVLIWLLLPPLVFTLPLLPVELHYLLPAYPAQYAAAGVFFSLLIVRSHRWRWVPYSLLMATLLVQSVTWLMLLFFVSGRATPGGFGIPVRYHLRAAEQAENLHRQGLVEEVLVAGASENPAEDEFAAVYDVLLRGTPHRFVDASRSALFPAGPAAVLLANDIGGPAVDAYLNAATGNQLWPLREGEGRLQVLTLPASAAPEPDVRLDPPLLYANWVNLTGYDALTPRPDGDSIWKIYWRTGDNPDPSRYHFFNHLLDDSGQLLAQEDAPTFSPWQWRTGDTVLSVFTLAWPADLEGPVTMRTGLYTFPSLSNVPLLDVSGRPASDAAELRLGQSP